MEVGRWDNHRLHAILQPHYPGVHFLKNIEWSLSMAANHVFQRLMHFYTHLLHLLQPSVLWLSIVTFMMQSHRQSEFCANLMYHESDRRLEGSLHLSCKRDQIKIRDYMDRRVTPTKWAITIPTCNLQRKRESRRQASEAQREKGRQRSRARNKKQRRHYFWKEQHENLVAAVTK